MSNAHTDDVDDGPGLPGGFEHPSIRRQIQSWTPGPPKTERSMELSDPILRKLCEATTRDMGWVGLALSAGIRVRHQGMEETSFIVLGKHAGQPVPILYDNGIPLPWTPNLADLKATSWPTVAEQDPATGAVSSGPQAGTARFNYRTSFALDPLTWPPVRVGLLILRQGTWAFAVRDHGEIVDQLAKVVFRLDQDTFRWAYINDIADGMREPG